MNQKYADCVEQISQILFQAITEREENLVGTIERLDSNLLSLLRTIGLRVMSRRARSLAPFLKDTAPHIVGAGSLVNVNHLVS